MSENSKIEWCDSTWNPWEGCQKVGPGCNHCYAEARNARFGGGTAVNWGPGAARRRTSATNWRKPLAWNAQPFVECVACHWRGARRDFVRRGPNDLLWEMCPMCNSVDFIPARMRVFCASLADVFDKAVDPAWRVDLFRLIAKTPNLDWLLLTKRIGNAHAMLNEVVDQLSCGLNTWDELPWPGVWLGATIVDQVEADRDIEKLLMTPARRRFLSMEPLLGPVDLRSWFDPTGVCCMQEMQSCENCPADAPWIHGPTTDYAEDGSGYSSPEIDWVIVGGESGPGARPMHPDWARALRDQCATAGVPFLFKQWGEWLPVEPNGTAIRGCGVTPVREPAFRFAANHHFTKVGKRSAGRHLDGRLQAV
ncbi:phage Gp37/Gp68 family protein [Burkholderia pyrrocinia]|uniref:phage Gp37/Gp68 family protein n=1 Tax=Burkholderia pyrrocinia TaxID=60550 RepID=UPI001BCA8B76|nr:phage Gp37/Gp68 family protein [Burkholderia pyrrocinia]QVN19287.1 phage Gp37/Gp68 family protein [Burkholderia pyrrocinia]